MLIGRRVAAAALLGAVLAVGMLAAGALHARAAHVAGGALHGAAPGAGGRACSVLSQQCATGCALPIAGHPSAPAPATAPCTQTAASGPCVLPVSAVAAPPQPGGGAERCGMAPFERLRRSRAAPAIPRRR